MLHKGLIMIEPGMLEIEMDSVRSRFCRKLAIKTQFFKKVHEFSFFLSNQIWWHFYRQQGSDWLATGTFFGGRALIG